MQTMTGRDGLAPARCSNSTAAWTSAALASLRDQLADGVPHDWHLEPYDESHQPKCAGLYSYDWM